VEFQLRFVVHVILSLTSVWTAWGQQQPFFDRTHISKVFGEARHYRVFLPPDYDTSRKFYPVIYYFHGHSDRYTLEHYDNGTDTVPRIVGFVAKHDVIVVSVDGYVAKDYSDFYGGSPWDIGLEGGDYDFGAYFQELVAHVDATYRTLTDRRHRATAGLSMGGFMSLYLSARHPQLIGSASAFNPGPEFYVGDKGRRILWRPKDHVSNHTCTMIRLVRASGDYISQYHEETRAAYARSPEVSFEYRQDEYHKHWATSIEETFAFHEKAFANSALDNVPVVWSHANTYSSFEVWNYRIEAPGEEPAIIYLEDVTQGGLRITTRRWAPDGPPLKDRQVTLTTAPRYEAKQSYTVMDHNLLTRENRKWQVTSSSEGALNVRLDGAGHQISIIGPGSGGQPPVLLPLTAKDKLRLLPQKDHLLPLSIYNPRGEAMTQVKLLLSSEYPTVRIQSNSWEIPRIEAGAFVDVSEHFPVQFIAGAGYFESVRLRLNMTYDGWHETSKEFEVQIIPEGIPRPLALEVLDGRNIKLNIFRQNGNQGGGTSIVRELTEGKGNGNGILEPGEEATFWVKMAQGMDPFDKGNWYRCKVYTDSPWLTEVGDIQEPKQREWTSAQERTSLLYLLPKVPQGTTIEVLLDNESWGFHYTPDVRYGLEKLYQAFQLHTHHLHRYEVRVP
jgi:predicted alpha/beta superfamily hydrolase